ncbi:MAG TPA: SDR family NAD(P)-dependent oxidoreductase [Acidimicrobiales bacterium]|nr:SDR family NAD(P)-dependent oxidoreductase [Acidimicrobiales bacterium]
MRILVTGGTGFIGSFATVALTEAGHEVRLLARDPAKAERTFAPHPVGPAEVVRGDITDEASVGRALDGVDGVLHAAAVVAVSRRRAAEVLATNAAGTRNVVGGAVEAGVGRIVHTSSVSALFSPENPRVTPDTEVARPDSAYGQSKAEADLYVRGLQDEGAPVTIVYPGGVLGPCDPNPTLGAGHGAIVTNYRSGTPIIDGGGWAIVDVRDLADLYVACFGPDPVPPRLVLGGRTLSTDELNRTLADVAGRKVRRIPMSPGLLRGLGRLNDQLMRVVPVDFALTGEGMDYLTRWEPTDDTLALEVLGRPLRPTSETLADTVRWLCQAGHLPAKYAPTLAD